MRTALWRIARRHQALDEEIKEADREIGPLVIQAAPTLIALPGPGPESAGQLLTRAGDNPDRPRSEAVLAHLCGAAPVPASSGRTNRHRNDRGGDHAAGHTPHHRPGRPEVRPAHPGVHRPTHRRRHGREGHRPLPVTVRRPPDLPPPTSHDPHPRTAPTDR
ncbi:transposase [Streptomyces olivaceoviridis]